MWGRTRWWQRLAGASIVAKTTVVIVAIVLGLVTEELVDSGVTTAHVLSIAGELAIAGATGIFVGRANLRAGPRR
jgi:hypothetical protein